VERYLGKNPYLKILDFFLEPGHRDKKMILNRIAEKTEIHSYSASRFLKKLVEEKILNEERVGKRTKIYWLNTENPDVQVLLLINDIIHVVEQDQVDISKIKGLLEALNS
jgi:hypothetical protein